MHHPRLLLWLVAQPPEIQAVIHSLATSNSLTLFWDDWASQPLAVARNSTVRRVLDALHIEGLGIAVRAGVGVR